ncbi:MAG: aminotransferase class I/II-fold pyridoxal phosphate-dependent enzyme [Flavobacteriales bacterium]|nr:aminotransferase class I/II-fold pyridoxal phosphate-dependent enzyme [Flavobacteriales bacterium]
MNQIIPLFKNTHEQLGLTDPVYSLGVNDQTVLCKQFLSRIVGTEDVFFTKSCTQSLELAIMILNLPPNSEIILPSYGFVSLANAVALLGHKCVFVDCEIETLNISADAIEAAITERTKAVICINYAGVPCEYDKINSICNRNNLWLIEDNAHGFLANLNGNPLGSFGDISTFSFDHLKMITSYEGGALAINNKSLVGGASSCLDMGTNRSEFKAGKAPFYEWTSLGTNSVLAAPLFDLLIKQFHESPTILSSFVNGWLFYQEALAPLFAKHGIKGAKVVSTLNINGYIFWIMTRSATERSALIAELQTKGITLSPHYSALHKSHYGKTYHSYSGDMKNTEEAVAQMVRLPLFYGITVDEQKRVVSEIEQFYAELDG